MLFLWMELLKAPRIKDAAASPSPQAGCRKGEEACGQAFGSVPSLAPDFLPQCQVMQWR